MPTPLEEILVERARVGESVFEVDESKEVSDGCWMSGWFDTRTGRNELSITNEEPRHVTPMITKREPKRNNFGTTKMNIMDEIAPVKPNARSSFLRLLPKDTISKVEDLDVVHLP